MKNSILIFIPYFGRWPEWIDLFFDSVKRNPTIDFLIYTDCETDKYNFKNIKFRKIDFLEYVQEVNQNTQFNFNPENSYKLCDLRPMFGYLHQEEFKNFNFYGWCDIDLVFGNIREFYTDKILNNYDVFSTHKDHLSGHFALFRNTIINRDLFLKIKNWDKVLQNPKYFGIDEHDITGVLRKEYNITSKSKMIRILTKINSIFNKVEKKSRLFFKEQYTTPFTPIPWLDGTVNSEQPSKWFYNQGIITNERNLNHKFLYLHFMNFKSSQWRHDQTKAPWLTLERVYHVDDLQFKKIIEINENGIF